MHNKQESLPKIMGILNVTPDSMSSRGKAMDPTEVVAIAKNLIESGVDIIDVGAESTRPDGDPVSHDEEWGRLSPVLAKLVNLAHEAQVEVSVDTRHFQVAQRAIELGVNCINDVCGLSDPNMVKVISNSPSVKAIFTHSLSVPVIKEENLPPELDIVSFLTKWAIKKIDYLTVAGSITEDRLIFDPGLGFGKNKKHCFRIIKNVEVLKHALGIKICIGHSKKRFLSTENPDNREIETLALSVMPSMLTADYLRVHDTWEHKKAFKVVEQYYNA